jgi:(1->4)-alpha-D-glucan 1-alpha-D-glucosylmutase
MGGAVPQPSRDGRRGGRVVERHRPGSTYRLQLGEAFTLGDAAATLPYLAALGVTDAYLSPVFRARPRSTHGYDAVDLTRVGAVLGGDAAFAAFCRAARRHGLGVLLDIVPNHMAASELAPWWRDVLRHGRSSGFARYFDIFWPTDPAAPHRIGLPVLGEPYAELLARGGLRLTVTDDGVAVAVGERAFPLDPATWPRLLEHPPEPLRGPLAELAALPPREPADPARAAVAAGPVGRFTELYDLRAVRHYVDGALAAASDRRDVDGPLDRVLAAQAYRLEHWETAGRQIGYRRFFDISDLVGLRVEDADVFEATHARVFEWVGDGLIDGVRIDHVDGLRDPTGYLARLRERLDAIAAERGRAPAYLVVEKILSGAETLPDEWPVDGTTGYDFLDAANDIFVDPAGLGALDELWAQVTGMHRSFEELVHQKKRLVLSALFGGELSRLTRDLAAIAARLPDPPPGPDLRDAIVGLTAALPVYRTYLREGSTDPRDRGLIERACAAAGEAGAGRPVRALALVRAVLLGDPFDGAPLDREDCHRFTLAWQQLTGPAMAKGLEDTALYVYNRLISLNVVGGDPGDGERSVREFHRFASQRAARWPGTMNATSTHDSKRGEDVRARIHVLSELHRSWSERLVRWHELTAPWRPALGGGPVPPPSTEVLLYQTLVGAWPLAQTEVEDFPERIREYALKAAREAKLGTSWTRPDPDYEAALLGFVDRLVSGADGDAFLKDLLAFQDRVAAYGMVNGLGELLVKAMAPGVPDFYRGAELWVLTLVDPDNRRPVDFARRVRMLQDLEPLLAAPTGAGMAALLSRWEDGAIKLALTALVLRWRRREHRLLAAGDYRPIAAAGRRAEHACAFARSLGGRWAVTAVTRLPATLSPGGAPPPAGGWEDTALRLPPDAPRTWHDVLTGRTLEATDSGAAARLPLAELFGYLPVALLEGRQARDPRSGQGRVRPS